MALQLQAEMTARVFPRNQGTFEIITVSGVFISLSIIALEAHPWMIISSCSHSTRDRNVIFRFIFQKRQGLPANLFYDGSGCSRFPVINQETGEALLFPNGDPMVMRFFNFCYNEILG